VRHLNNAAFAFVSQALPKLSVTLLFIVLARTSGTTQAGAYYLAVSFVTVAVMLSSFGLEEMLIREVARDNGLARMYFSNSLLLRGLLSLIAYGCVWLSVKLVFHYEAPVEATVLLMAATIVPESLTDMVQALFVALGAMQRMALASSVISFLQVITGTLAILAFGSLPTLLKVVIAYSVLGLALNLLLALRLLRSVPRKRAGGPSGEVKPRFWRTLLRRTPPFVTMNTFAILEAQLDVTLLSVIGDIRQVAIYGAAKSIVTGLAMLSQAFRVAIYPALAKYYAESILRLQEFYRRSFQYLVVFSFALAVLLVTTAPAVIPLLFGPRYDESVLVLQILAVPLMVGFIYLPSTRLMIASHRERGLAVLLAASFGINLGANLVLIPYAGAVGSATARALSTAIYFTICDAYVSRKLFSIHSWRIMARCAVPATAMAAIVYLVFAHAWALSIVAGCGVYLVLVLWLKCVDAAHVRTIWQEYRRKLAEVTR
jgi:O-antigen/teichoic acid export membrane protein